MEKIKELLRKLTEAGVPLLFVKDPVSKLPSVSLTMMVVSFTVCVLGLFKLPIGIDVDNALELLIVTCSLYFGRSLSKKMSKEKE